MATKKNVKKAAASEKLFEGYERREKKILACLKEFGIKSIQECKEICDKAGDRRKSPAGAATPETAKPVHAPAAMLAAQAPSGRTSTAYSAGLKLESVEMLA